jgi:USP6 N-terminal-like protein
METPTVLISPALNRPFPHQRLSHTKNFPSKDSSESAIFSIYSMYGDEYNINSRASTSYHVAGKASYDPSLRTEPERQSFVPSDGPEDTDLVYYSSIASDSAAPPLISIPNGENGSSRASSSSSARPPSSYATPSSLRAHSDLFDRGLADLRTSDISTSSYTPAPSKECTRGESLHSKRSSRSSLPTKERSDRDLPPVPQDPPLLPPPPTYMIPSPTPSLQPFSSVSHVKPPGNYIVPPVSSPSSNVSLVPSEGEDIDAFHVRNTYAQLEVSGVKGDGYEEGIERTRARIGASRSSQMQADAALGDGKEKTRDLDEKEIQVLKSVDRCVFSTNIPRSLISEKNDSATASFPFLLMTD